MVFFSAISFSPYWVSRFCASAWVRPSRDEPSFFSTSARGRVCRSCLPTGFEAVSGAIHVSFHGRRSFRRRCQRASACDGREFYLLAFARKAPHGTNEVWGANIRARKRGLLPRKTISACNAAKVRPGMRASASGSLRVLFVRRGSTGVSATSFQRNDRLTSISLKNSAFGSAAIGVRGGFQRGKAGPLCTSGGEDRLRKGDELRQFP